MPSAKALVVRHPAPALQLAATGGAGRCLRPRLHRPGPAPGERRKFLGAELRRMVHYPVRQRQSQCGLVNINPAPAQQQWNTLSNSRLQLADRRRAFKTSDFTTRCSAICCQAGARRVWSELAQRAPAGTARRDQPGRAGAGELPCTGRACRELTRRSERRGCASARLRYSSTSDQHRPPPAHRLRRHPPATATSLNNGYMVGESLGLGAGRPPGDPVPLSLLRHGDGQPRLRHPRLDHVHPAPSFDAEATLLAVAEERATPRVRGTDHVHRRAGSSAPPRIDLSSLRTGIMAGATCPIG